MKIQMVDIKDIYGSMPLEPQQKEEHMPRRPKMPSFHEIVVKGRKVQIMVAYHLKGDTTAMLIKFLKPDQVSFIPKRRRPYAHVMQFNPDLKGVPSCWSIVDLLSPIRSTPVDSVPW